ncbi:MAG: zinc ABC transporter substrate-binding protein [Acidobacteriota bacterium]
MLHPSALRSRVLGLFLVASLFPLAQGPSAAQGPSTAQRESAEQEPLRVTVTVPPLVWLISEIAGPGVVVDSLVGEGEAPETFQPTDRHITGVARSALFFRLGVAAENGPWMEALESRGQPKVVDLRQGLSLLDMGAYKCHHNRDPGQKSSHGHRHGGHEHGHHGHKNGHHGHEHEGLRGDVGKDPHIWLSPRRLTTMAVTIARHLGEVDPQRRKLYTERAVDVIARLKALDAEIAVGLAPVRGGTFFVFHPAWGYFADDYGLRQAAIEVDGQDPTEAELTQLIKRARELGARTLFVQPQVRATPAEAVARALGADVETLDPLATDLPDNLRRVSLRLKEALRPVDPQP